MMRISNLAMLCGLTVIGLGALAWADKPQAESGRRPRGSGSAASRPADKANFAGKAATRPAGERPPAGERGRWGWWREQMEGAEGDRWHGPGGFEGGSRHGGPDGPVLSPQEKEEVITFVRDRFPELYQRLKRFQDTDPDAYGRAVQRLAMPMRHMMKTCKSDPQLAAMMIAEHRVELELDDLTSRYAALTSDADRQQTRSRIHQLIEKRFDLRQQRLEMEIRNMQKRLDQAQGHLAQQAASRPQLIDAEVKRMVDRLGKERRGGAKTRPSAEGPPRAGSGDRPPAPSGER